MNDLSLKPLSIELFFDIMSPQPLTLFQIHNENRTNTNLTTILTPQLVLNISQTIMQTNLTDYTNMNNYNSLLRYKTLYRNYHGLISTFVCLFGLTCNLFNIIVLTRPLMRSATNTILTSLALSDLIKMLFVLPAAILFYCLQPTERKSEPDFASRFQVTFYMIQMLVTLTLHCISTWLTVLLAGFRYVFLSCKNLTGYVSTPDRAVIGVSTVVIVSTVLCIPSYIEHRIVEVLTNQTYSNGTNKINSLKLYRFAERELSRKLSLRETVFVLHGVIFKLIPCILLILFSFLLIQQLRHALAKAEKIQKHSLSFTGGGGSSGGGSNHGRLRGRRREKENRRTTLMLVIVCALFLLTELPQGAILLLTFLSKDNSKHYYQIYQQLGDTFDILALINNSVNFILYCLMSRAFRDTFKQTFCHPCHKYDRRESTISITQLSVNKKRQLHINSTTVGYESIPALQNFNNSTKIPLLEDNQSNGLSKKNSSSS